MWQLVLLSLSALSGLATAQRRPCYYPDGSRAVNYMACDGLPVPEDDSEIPHSACCAIDDNVVCLSSNLCYNRFGYIYRGGCTDQTWSDPACPSEQCTSFDGSGMNILACNDATGYWCCADGAEVPCCQNENITQFYLNPGTVTFVAEGLSTVSLSTSTSTTSAESTTSTEAATTTTSSETSATAVPQAAAAAISTGAAVGMGIGITIPTILAIVFASLWWFERLKRKRLDVEPILPPAPFGPGHPHSYGGRVGGGGGGGGLRPPSELQSGSFSSELSSGYDGRPVDGVDVMELSARTVKPPGYIGSH